MSKVRGTDPGEKSRVLENPPSPAGKALEFRVACSISYPELNPKLRNDRIGHSSLKCVVRGASQLCTLRFQQLQTLATRSGQLRGRGSYVAGGERSLVCRGPASGYPRCCRRMGTAVSRQRNSKMEAKGEQQPRQFNEVPGRLEVRTHWAESSIRRRSGDSSSRSQTCALCWWRHASRNAMAAKIPAHRSSAVDNRLRQSRLPRPLPPLPVQWSVRCEQCARFRGLR